MYMSDNEYDAMGKIHLKKAFKKLKKVVKKVAPLALTVTGAVGGGILGAKAGQLLSSKLNKGSGSTNLTVDKNGRPYESMSRQELLNEQARLMAFPPGSKDYAHAQGKLANVQLLLGSNTADASVPMVNTQSVMAPPIQPQSLPAAMSTTMPAAVSEPAPYMSNDASTSAPELETIDVTGQRPQQAGFGGNNTALLIGAGLLGLVLVMDKKGGRSRRAKRGSL